MKDLAKRKRVMARSMQLGHCICDPKKPCPCDTLRELDLCPCAGERPEPAAGPVRLTEMVSSAGCASKIDAATLRRVLAGLRASDDPRVLVGMPAGDDAGVYRVDERVTLVQTVDVFSPSVDDPYQFGQIAAANSVSDIYAMGARPITALSILGFPARSLPEDIMRRILEGGIDKMAEAGVAVVGGHSIQDAEIKAGFAVTGLVDPARIMTNAAARPADRLILTKPLGTGIVAFAAQIGRAPAGSVEAAGRWMAALNDRAAQRMVEAGAHAATDVTGFGLMGHLAAMASASGVDVEIVWDDLPLLPGVLECLAQGILPGAAERNRESSAAAMIVGAGVEPAMLDLCFDPQTSGGLLISVPESGAARLLDLLREDGLEAAEIGRVVGGGQGRVRVQTSGRRRISNSRAPGRGPDAPAHPESRGVVEENQAMSCCPNPSESAAASDASTGEATQEETPTGKAAQEKFVDFLHAANAPGALDGRTKRAIAIALSVLAKCDACVKIHMKKAREEGFTEKQIEEAAWMAIAFGGSPTMMFYNGVKKG